MRRHALLPLLALLASLAQAQPCELRERLRDPEGKLRCLSEFPVLQTSYGRGRNWVPTHGVYTLALSQAQCPPVAGVGTNNNSPLDHYARQRDDSALDYCQRGLRELTAPTGCTCQIVARDGDTLVDAPTFQALMRMGPAPGAPVQMAETARIEAPQPPASRSTAPVTRASQAQAERATPAAAPPAALTPRRALVIGNRDYVVGPLKNPVNDARAMSAALSRLGFKVSSVENLKRDDIGPELDRFVDSIRAGDDIVLFYAGHGLQVKGINYLPAVDARIRGESDVALNSINLNQLLERLDESKAGVRLLLLDACRDNPYSRGWRSSSRGLARVTGAPAGTLMHFATRPGGVAADGDGPNGLYTTHLLQHLSRSGEPVELVLKAVAAAVRTASGGAQQPWMEGSLDGDFYFVPEGR